MNELKSAERLTITYDLTRMCAYLDRKFPSGIERVDINYLHGFLLNSMFIIKGILEVEVNGKIYLVKIPDELVLKIKNHLYNRWILSISEDSLFVKHAKEIENELIAEINKYCIINADGIDVNIIKLHKPNSKIFYFNACFINIADGKQHYKLIKSAKLVPIYIIHDIIPIEYPEYTFGDQNKLHLERLITAFDLEANIIAISEHVKIKINLIATSLGYKNINIHVNNNGIDAKFINRNKSIHKSINKKNQFIYVSTIEPRKNHALLLNVWKKIINETNSSAETPKLIIIGRRGWNNQLTFDMLDKNASLREFIVEINNASDDEIIRYIDESKAMLFPSFDEGWGLPIVESLAIGTPVICSDILVHHECTQGNAIFLDPIDGLSWFECIMKISKDTLKIDSGNFLPISWEKSCIKLQKIIISINNKQ